MKTYYDNVLKEETTTLCLVTITNRDGILQLVASMQDDQAPREWELQIDKDMGWYDNYQSPMIYWSWDIVKSMIWFMRQPANAEHLIYAPQNRYISDTPPKRLYTEVHTADWR